MEALVQYKVNGKPTPTDKKVRVDRDSKSTLFLATKKRFTNIYDCRGVIVAVWTQDKQKNQKDWLC